MAYNISITENDQEVVVPLQGRFVDKTIEVGFQGDFGGGIISAFRRYLDDAGVAIGEDVPLVFSWQDLTQVTIDGPVGGLTFQQLQAESAIVFKLTGATDPDIKLFLLGIKAE